MREMPDIMREMPERQNNATILNALGAALRTHLPLASGIGRIKPGNTTLRVPSGRNRLSQHFTTVCAESMHFRHLRGSTRDCRKIVGACARGVFFASEIPPRKRYIPASGDRGLTPNLEAVPPSSTPPAGIVRLRGVEVSQSTVRRGNRTDVLIV